MTKQCKMCKEDFEEFITQKGNSSVRCPECLKKRTKLATARHHRIMRTPETENLRNREYYSKHREDYKQMRFRNSLKNKYGITEEDYFQMWKNQDGKCAICGIGMVRISVFGNPTKTQPCVDHNHLTGKVRALLCRGCNLKLEIIDNNNFLTQATQYLDKFKM